MNQINNTTIAGLDGWLFIVGLIVLGFWGIWFITTLGIRQEQNEFREEMKWRLDAIIELLKKKE